MRTSAKGIRLLTLALSLAAVSSIASGYYNWVFFAGDKSPFNPIPAKFNLNSLPNSNTISFFISNQQPSAMVQGDSFPALVSQIRAAANVWNQVPTSSLRLTFGGMEAVPTTTPGTPGIDVVFDDDMPPGLLAQTRPSLPADLSFLNGTQFVPISRSRIQLRSDLTVYQQASYYDSVFLTIVHEFGHALGLQHTLTSGIMSTDITRATSKAAPLSADDVAGVSSLYPAGNFTSNTGAIAGTVLQGGAGVNLASVVALNSITGVAISTMTNPDGTYYMGGVPSGQYYVYAHPLPPSQPGESYPDNIWPPMDSRQNIFSANTGMDTQFYSSSGGTRQLTQAGQVTVTPGVTNAGINFPNMQKRTGPAIYDMQTCECPGGGLIIPEPWLISGSRLWLVFSASGATVNSKLVSGLNVAVIGGAAYTEPGTLFYYGDGTPAGYNGAKVVLDTNPVAVTTPVALAVTVPTDLYVLPQAFTVVSSPAPAISSVTATGTTDALGDPIVTVSGANLSAATQILFDGAQALVQSANSDGSLTVVAPPAVANYTASVEALSSDGQTSQQAQGIATTSFTPATVNFTYSGPANPSISLNQGQLLQPGTEAEVDIVGVNTNFTYGQVSVGLGISDIVVDRVWVKSPTEVLLNVTVLQTAPVGPVQLTVASGLQTLSAAVQVQVPNQNQMSLQVPILNAATNLEAVPPGGGAYINTTGIPQNLTSWTMTVGGQSASFFMGGANQIGVQIPSGLTPGPAVVQLTSPNGDQIPPVVMQIVAAPPAIAAVVNSSGPIGSSNPARRGDTLTITVAGLVDPASTVAPAAANVQINVGSQNGVGGVNHTASTLLAGAQPGTAQIQFTLSQSDPYGPGESLTVGLGPRISPAVYIAISQ